MTRPVIHCSVPVLHAALDNRRRWAAKIDANGHLVVPAELVGKPILVTFTGKTRLGKYETPGPAWLMLCESDAEAFASEVQTGESYRLKWE